MSQTWSSIKQHLEKDLLCEKRSGRVQYCLTVSDNDDNNPVCGKDGIFAVYVDGEEIISINQKNEVNNNDDE